MSFLLLHGWQNRRPAGHWQHWLATELRSAGHEVIYPQLPDPDEPVLDDWLAALRTHVTAVPGGPRTVIAHSLSCLLWLHAAARGTVPAPVDRVLLVAPPSPEVAAGIPEIAGFVSGPVAPLLTTGTAGPAGSPVTRERFAAAARDTHLVAADDDRYCPGGAAAILGMPLGIPTTVLTGQGHLDMDAGYGPWPAILGWALTGSPLAPR
ncbi:RBBP9/YdeN family alpha/beta hydrolase [Actinoplanes sp. G11-F43]|uniref:RBBP9/YdeN family alpha/beta hydrolase n=1 Tax=Actinoplanes sp. G11-F43 TaxID=3424130 RepID=UPI003D3421CE